MWCNGRVRQACYDVRAGLDKLAVGTDCCGVMAGLDKLAVGTDCCGVTAGLDKPVMMLGQG